MISSAIEKLMMWNGIRVERSVNRRVLSLILACMLGFCTAGSVCAQQNEFIFGLIPQGAALKMYERWAPFIERLSRETGLKFQVKVYDHASEFENSLSKGTIDFAYLNSTQEAMAFNRQGYIPLVRSEKFFRGTIFVPIDSKIQSIFELKDKNIAFVSEKSLCSVVLRQELAKVNNVSEFNTVYAGSSSNVFKYVILGKAVAGGTLDVSIKRESPEIAKQLRTLWESPEMAPHPIAAHPRTPEKARKLIIQSMMKIAEDEQGQKLLELIRMPAPLTLADYQRDYKWLEKYMLE